MRRGEQMRQFASWDEYPSARRFLQWEANHNGRRTVCDFPGQDNMAMPRDSESFRRYDLNLAQVAASVEDLFDYDRNRREYEQAKFFLPVPLQGILHYPTGVSYSKAQGLSHRLRDALKGDATFVQLSAIALNVMLGLKAIVMSNDRWTEYKNFIRHQDAKLEERTGQPTRSPAGHVPVLPMRGETANEYAAVWVMRLRKKSESAFHKIFKSHGMELSMEEANFGWRIKFA
ncbi:hypothetical protein AeRB84_007994 [Aphanomyces euteiches]|nr:hypothetical protein AeRB84_007994 [Aphanomyces euteiches]